MTTDALFDPLAPTYDDDFTRSPIARHLRTRVHARLDALIQPEQHALELGCGTGEDALHLAQRGVHITATDASDAMLAIAQQKLAPFPHANTERLDLHTLTTGDRYQLSGIRYQPDSSTQYRVQSTALRTHNLELDAQHPEPRTENSELKTDFSLVYANFGVLNCLSDWRPLAAWLAERVLAGGHVAFGIMSPCCIWETLWHGAHGDWRTATRRWRKQGAEFKVHSSQFSAQSLQVSGISYQPSEHGTQNPEPRTTNYELRTENSSLIHYPAVRRLTRDFAPWFRRVHVEPLGVFLPPSDVYGVIEKRPRLLERLMQMDERTTRLPFLANFADHYWLELQRRHDGS